MIGSPLSARHFVAGPGQVVVALCLGLACAAAATLVNPLFAVAGVIAALIGVVVATDGWLAFRAFIVVAALLPYGVIPISIAGIRPTLVDAMLTLLLVGAAGALLARRVRWRPATAADTPIALFLAVSVAAFVLGTAYAITPEGTRQYAKLVNSALFFFTVTQLLSARRHVEETARWLVAAGAGAAAVGIVLYHLPAETATTLLRTLRPLGYPSGDVLRYVEDAGVRTDTLRAIGTSVDPNIFGALLLLTGVFAFGALFAATGRGRIPYALAVATIGYALLVSLSRGAWVGLGVALALMIAIRYRRAALLAVPIIAIASVALSPQLSRFAEHLLKALYVQDQATGMRLGEYKDALTLIQQYPILGVGFGAAPTSDLYLGVSSTYLLVAEEMGLIGLGLFLLIAYRVVATGLRGYGASDETARPLILTSTAAFVAFLVAALFDRHFFDLRFPHVAALFWLSAAMVMLSTRLNAADNGSAG